MMESGMEADDEMRPAVECGNAAHRRRMECRDPAMPATNAAAVESTEAAKVTSAAMAAAKAPASRRSHLRRKHAERNGGHQRDHHLPQ